jgi:hypothetical protein
VAVEIYRQKGNQMSKTIRINESYFIEVEERQLTLKKNVERTKKDGTKYIGESIYGYFSNLHALLTKLFKLKIFDKVEGEITLKELHTILIETQAEIDEICETIRM